MHDRRATPALMWGRATPCPLRRDLLPSRD